MRVSSHVYFDAKSDVISNEPDRGLPELWEALVERPPGEGDIDAIRHTLKDSHATRVDTERAVLQARAIAMVLFGEATRNRVAEDGRGTLADSIDRSFDRLSGLLTTWTTPATD